MADHPMATVLFISVFVFLFFKFCLGAAPLPLSAGLELDGDRVGEGGNAPELHAGAPLPHTHPLPLAAAARGRGVFKCPVGTVRSPATGECKDLVRSTKGIAERLQLLMPYLLAEHPNGPNGNIGAFPVGPR